MNYSINISAGSFAIRPDKKSDPVMKTAKHVGMIAGGTGKHIIMHFIIISVLERSKKIPVSTSLFYFL